LIESSYWREELRADIRWLRTKQKFKRWSEKQMVLYERKLMLVAFQIRTLLERPKVNDWVKSLKLQASKYTKLGDKPFTLVGPGSLEDRFDLTSPEAVQLSIWDVCNQLIHYYWMTTASESGRFSSILLFSDYKRHICAYEFEITSMIELFTAYSDECSGVHTCSFVWNNKKQDYEMVDAHGPNTGNK